MDSLAPRVTLLLTSLIYDTQLLMLLLCIVGFLEWHTDSHQSSNFSFPMMDDLRTPQLCFSGVMPPLDAPPGETQVDFSNL